MAIDESFIKAFDKEAAKYGKDFGKYYVRYHLKNNEDLYPVGDVIELKTGKVKTTVYKGYLDLNGKRYLWHEKTSKDLRSAIEYAKKIHKDIHTLMADFYEEWFDDEIQNFTIYEFKEETK